MVEQDDLRAKAHEAAIEAWDTFEVRWISDPVQPRLLAAADAVSEVYEARLRDRGDFGRKVTFFGGPADGIVVEVEHLDPHAVVRLVEGKSLARPQVYRLNFQALRYEHEGHICPGEGPQ